MDEPLSFCDGCGKEWRMIDAIKVVEFTHQNVVIMQFTCPECGYTHREEWKFNKWVGWV